MPGGFNNQIVGGIGKLIREWIQSPNFVTGVSGWSINKDGSAEFLNAVFRGQIVIESSAEAILVYDGPAAFGNLILAISAASSVDPYGNHYPFGITVFETSSTLARYGLKSDTTAGQLDGYVESDSTSQIMAVKSETLDALNIINVKTGGAVSLLADSIRIGAQASTVDIVVTDGFPGRYSAQLIEPPSGQTVINNTGVQITGWTASRTNGVDNWDPLTGLWTCSDDGLWSFTFSIGFTTWVAGSRFILAMNRNGTATANSFARNDLKTEGGSMTLSARKYMFAGDTVNFRVLQATGGTITIADDERSYICVQREL